MIDWKASTGFRQCQGPIYCRSLSGELWIGRLQLLFSFSDDRGKETEAAFLRWYEQKPVPPDARHLGLTYFAWSRVRLPGSAALVPDYDIVTLDCIEGPIMLQPDPKQSERWFHNHFF